MPTNVDLINTKLEDFYASRLEAWQNLRFQQQPLHLLSIPIFIKAFSSFLSARYKIIFVGQETHGWFTDYTGDIDKITAREIMDFYERYWPILYQDYTRSPYWRAMRHIANGLRLSDSTGSFLFSNIFPCDVDRRQAPLALHDEFRKWAILPYELNVLEPNYVIFFCGPKYYGNLKSYFGKWPDQPVSKTNPLVSYAPPGAPWKGFVTYHPGYLQRSGSWNILDQIINSIACDKGDAPPGA